MDCLTPTASFDLSMDNYFTSFRYFVYLSTLELTTFKQEVCSAKIGYKNTSGENSCKKKKKKKIRSVITLNSAVNIKQKCFVACVNKTTRRRFRYLLLNLANLAEFFSALEQSSKRVCSRKTTKSISLLQP